MDPTGCAPRSRPTAWSPAREHPETFAEQVYATAGGATGRHLGAIVAPLLVHDLPVHALVAGRAAVRHAGRART